MRFFKTAPGQYGHGDRFLGIRVPVLRQLARTHRSLPVDDALTLLASKWHEERSLALFLLVGWMLREIGKRDGNVERLFLDKHGRTMPRTMLRYAIEKFPEAERRRYMQGTPNA